MASAKTRTISPWNNPIQNSADNWSKVDQFLFSFLIENFTHYLNYSKQTDGQIKHSLQVYAGSSWNFVFSFSGWSLWHAGRCRDCGRWRPRRGKILVTRILRTAACITAPKWNTWTATLSCDIGTCSAAVTVVPSEAIFNANKRAVHQLDSCGKTPMGNKNIKRSTLTKLSTRKSKEKQFPLKPRQIWVPAGVKHILFFRNSLFLSWEVRRSQLKCN